MGVVDERIWAYAAGLVAGLMIGLTLGAWFL